MKEGFRFSVSLENFLFKGLNIKTNLGLFAVCAATAFLVIVLEICKTFMVYFVQKQIQAQNPVETHGPHLQALSNNFEDNQVELNHSPERLITELETHPTPADTPVTWRSRLLYHFLGSIIYLLHAVLGYIIMLAVMSYNAWIFVSVCAVSGFGYFVFGAVRNHITSNGTTPGTSEPNSTTSVSLLQPSES